MTNTALASRTLTRLAADTDPALADKYQRQTGRTQAMLLAAHAAANGGHTVLVVMADQRECDFAERRLDAMRPVLQSEARHRVRIANLNTVNVTAGDTLGRRFAVVLIDHHAAAALAAAARKNPA